MVCRLVKAKREQSYDLAHQTTYKIVHGNQDNKVCKKGMYEATFGKITESFSNKFSFNSYAVLCLHKMPNRAVNHDKWICLFGEAKCHVFIA